jgi:hypothetical protein
MTFILTSRPLGMDYDTYRSARKESQRQIKNYLRGSLNRQASTEKYDGQGKLIQSSK